MSKPKKPKPSRAEILEKLRAYQREHIERLNTRKPGTYGPN